MKDWTTHDLRRSVATKLADVGHINPLHMGVVIITTLVFGLITPPYGLSLLVASKYVGVGFGRAVVRSLPLYIVFFVTIAFRDTFPFSCFQCVVGGVGSIAISSNDPADYPDDSLIAGETGRNREAVLYLIERASCPLAVLGAARVRERDELAQREHRGERGRRGCDRGDRQCRGCGFRRNRRRRS